MHRNHRSNLVSCFWAFLSYVYGSSPLFHWQLKSWYVLLIGMRRVKLLTLIVISIMVVSFFYKCRNYKFVFIMRKIWSSFSCFLHIYVLWKICLILDVGGCDGSCLKEYKMLNMTLYLTRQIGLISSFKLRNKFRYNVKNSHLQQFLTQHHKEYLYER